MNNCPKCGNPLQIGINDCPICGTNINNVNQVPGVTPVTQNQAVAPVTQQPVVTPVTSPVQQPVVQNVPVQPVAPTMSTPTPVVPAQNESISVQPEAPAPVLSDNSMTTPTETKVEEKKEEKVEQLTVDVPQEKKKFQFDKKLLTIAGVIALFIIVGTGAFMLYMNNKSDLKVSENQKEEQTEKTENVAVNKTSTKITNNNFTYELPNDWTSITYNEQFMIVNKEENTAISLGLITGLLSNATKEQLMTATESQGVFTNVTVEETNVNSKKAYVINANYNGNVIQIYYIDNINNIISATIVYTDETSKTNNQNNVLEIINSIVYNETVNAISSNAVYTSINLYKDSIFTKASTPTTQNGVTENTTPQANNSTGNQVVTDPATSITPTN